MALAGGVWIHANSFLDPWFRFNHRVFDKEDSCHNFNLSNSGRIWIKWDPLLIQFNPTHFTTQLISDELHRGLDLLCVLSVIYASNSPTDRIQLWDKIGEIGTHITSYWLIFGDFKCCLHAEEKFGGSSLLASHLWDFNSLAFDLGLLDLASTGLKYTWFNQRANERIHLKLDRMLINDKWLESFSRSYYEVLSPSCSDHSPIVLYSGQPTKLNHRFHFKNFWTKQGCYWAELLNTFSQPSHGNPILGWYSKLKNFKESIKGKTWANSCYLSTHLSSLKDQQSLCLGMLNIDPQNICLNQRLKSLNAQIYDCSSSWSNWVLERAKLKLLSHGEDDLKFLYARIRKRRNHSSSPLVSSEDPIVRQDLINSITQHFEKLFNATQPAILCDPSLIPKGTVIPSHLSDLLTVMVTNDEIKAVIFHGSSNSSPGLDGFNFEFYKSSWLITGPLVCKAVKSFFSKGMKDIMPLIIGDNQAGFIKNHIATDNILLASEVLLDFKKSAKKNLMCAKLDIHKAFNSVSREFILARMRHKGFPLPLFTGLRLASLMFTFPFVLMVLWKAISTPLLVSYKDAPLALIYSDSFIGIQKKDMKISHMLNADDLLIFGEDSLNNYAVLREVLDSFANISGLLHHAKVTDFVGVDGWLFPNSVNEGLNLALAHIGISTDAKNTLLWNDKEKPSSL
ncbi:uncharacterized protein LOC110094176 [Dendrobium catenatum]|uniref:uncharacterized protein LOC110094176 n=1 Tax=Dendrobium catenatum TaxID=906689 RepID=UPI0009F45D8E|nr:uncharacterized protein LOC110094176 [Dendrobium catenatum]